MKNNTPLQKNIATSISAAISQKFSLAGLNTIAGGCINATYVVNDGDRYFFIKLNTSRSLFMFEAEYQALLELENSNTIRVPHPVCTGLYDKHSWLVMEHLSLHNNGNHHKLGEQLAAMHRLTRTSFGWDRDNTIGSTPQINTPDKDWLKFFRNRRLQYQLRLAAANGYTGSLQKAGAALVDCMDDFFIGYKPVPSLLHGDLWSGNYAFIENGDPVLFDPALYYGDREADIAMTELFGGFSSEFRSSYEDCWPLDDGYKTRRYLYNCYHILNHLNLFGGGYARQAEDMIMRLLSERNA
ncbi:MAG TPA: fructosamine kinase family protein [Gammaproteobacteria bacterium]|nr:fructosamine kinase family protein [Gammaproteobacteria bacterium]